MKGFVFSDLFSSYLSTVSNIICVNFAVQLSLVENFLQASTVEVLQVLPGCFSS